MLNELWLLSKQALEELKQVVALARKGKLRRIPIEKRPLSEVSRTLDRYKAGKIVGRVVADITAS